MDLHRRPEHQSGGLDVCPHPICVQARRLHAGKIDFAPATGTVSHPVPGGDRIEHSTADHCDYCTPHYLPQQHGRIHPPGIDGNQLPPHVTATDAFLAGLLADLPPGSYQLQREHTETLVLQEQAPHDQ